MTFHLLKAFISDSWMDFSCTYTPHRKWKRIFYDICLMLYLIFIGARLESTHVNIITSLRGHLLLVKPPYFLYRNNRLCVQRLLMVAKNDIKLKRSYCQLCSSLVFLVATGILRETFYITKPESRYSTMSNTVYIIRQGMMLLLPN